ncbi:right-handed parallel beta-helix repeat-containing protein [Candidatus Dojkabacteria bacterium]|uniref:Right-handed parallel beta-helix repeat-containing protein n=1 Tax=Candidatus Dojkabacteria bacterium TaxID=2099670 RepID=A0A955L807_9BACT|nr:right-handed parallel beta-helix repeat-containing protein [Candidatus Dojkabacteria bacterium]
MKRTLFEKTTYHLKRVSFRTRGVVLIVLMVLFALGMGVYVFQENQAPEEGSAAILESVTVCPDDFSGDISIVGCTYSGAVGIREAYNDVADGWTVKLIPGVYDTSTINGLSNLTPFLSLTKSVSIQNSDQDEKARIISSNSSVDAITISANNVTIQGLEVTGFRSAIDLASGSNFTIIASNFHTNVAGIVARGNSSGRIIKNSIYENTGIGIEGQDSAVIQIQNNTLYGNESYGLLCQGSSDCTIINNIAVNNNNGGIFIASTDNVTQLAYNDSFANNQGNWNSNLGINWPPGTNISQDPFFVNVNDKNFRLQNNSPAIDTGHPLIEDFDGTRSDMGAFGGGTSVAQCVVNEDCSGGQVCMEGICGVISDPSCENGSCVTCSEASECSSNQTCDSGNCMCTFGYQNCDDNFVNGCETQVLTSQENCGACGNVCEYGFNCISGECTETNFCEVDDDCPEPESNQRAICVDPSTKALEVTSLAYACQSNLCIGRGIVQTINHETCIDGTTCIDGACLSEEVGECSIDSDCPAGGEQEQIVCINDTTLATEVSTSSYTCTTANTCSESIVTTFINEQSCSTGKICQAGSCVDPGSDDGSGDTGGGVSQIPERPVFNPISESQFVSSLDVVISALEDSIETLEYRINNGDIQTYTSDEKPLSFTLTINETSIIEARSVRGELESSFASATYPKISLTNPTNLAFSCESSGAGVTFTWAEVPGAKAYLVRINRDGVFNPADPESGDQFVFTQNSSYTAYNISAGNIYQSWSVQPLTTNDQDPDNYDSTKNLESLGGQFNCNSASADIPSIDPYQVTTFLDSITISGTKPGGASILVDGVEVVPINSSQTWSTQLALNEMGLNSFKVQTQTVSGNYSQEVPVYIRKCLYGDINCDEYVNIADFALFIEAIQIQVKLDRGEQVQKYQINVLSDMNIDSKNDVGDFGLFKSEYLKHN